MERKTILVVDDEPMIREMVRVMLAGQPYDLVDAGNGIEALACLEKQPVDLILTDIIMPDSDGIELVMALRRSRPGMKVIVMSGGGRVRAGHYLDLARRLGAAYVIEKPFDAATLCRVIKEQLEPSAGQQEKS
jgi:DNA-binding NtrC family response regulator